jgi:Nif-specific regulatory protein
MERLAYMTVGDTIDADELSFIMSPTSPRPSLLDSDQPLSEATRQFQIAYIQSQVDRARGNMTDAAERLGLHRSNLYRKMHQLGMQTSDE